MSRTRPRRLLASILPPPGVLPVGIIMLLALISAGCSDDPIEKPNVENFARAWHLTLCEYRHETNSALRVDLVADGCTVDLFINDNGMFLYACTPPGGSQETWGGTWTVDGETVNLTREGFGFAWAFTAEVREESMTMRGAHAEYDFGSDGTPEPAIWNMAGQN